MKAIPHINAGSSGVVQMMLETNAQGTPGTPSEGEGWTETTSNMNIYVATTGNDVTGDGTASKPYATITKAESEVPYLLKHNVRIRIAAGTYTDFPEIINHPCQDNGQLSFDGVSGISDDLGTLTIGSVSDFQASLFFGTFKEITVSGASWSTDEHKGKFIFITSGGSTGHTAAIWSNTADTLTVLSSVFYPLSASQTFILGTPQVVVNLSAGKGISIRVTDEELQSRVTQIYNAKYSRIALGYIDLNLTDRNFIVQDTDIILHACNIDSGAGGVNDRSGVLSSSNVNTFAPISPTNVFTASNIFGFLASPAYFGTSVLYMQDGELCGVLAASGVRLDYSMFNSFRGCILNSLASRTSFSIIQLTMFDSADNATDSLNLYDYSRTRVSAYFNNGRNMIRAECAEIWGSYTGNSSNYTQYGLKAESMVKMAYESPCDAAGALGEIYFEMSDTVENWPNLYRHAVSDGKGSFIVKNSASGD